jgi:hypothetical protein
MDGHLQSSEEQNRAQRIPVETLAHYASSSPLSPSKIVRARAAVAGSPAGWRSGVVVRLLADERCSPEDECAVIERLRGDALKSEPEPVDAGKRRCSGSTSQTPTRSYPVTAVPGESRGAAFFFSGFKPGFLFHFFLDPILTYSNLNHFLVVHAVKH